MGDYVDIVCPPLGLGKRERLQCSIESIAAWLYSDAFQELVGMEGGLAPACKNVAHLAAYVEYLVQFAQRWDFRNGGKERFEVKSAAIHRAEEVMECAAGLGLCASGIDRASHMDYLAVCGGARYSNLARPLAAARLAQGLPDVQVVGLAGMRPISEKERPFMSYAPDAETEFDALTGGMMEAFRLGGYSDARLDGPADSGLAGTYRAFSAVSGTPGTSGASCVSALSTWSHCSTRRANSRDTFEMFLGCDRYAAGPSSRISLVTSDIYRSYQLLRFLDLAIENDLYVSAVGSGFIDESPSVNTPVSYLQEIKANIDAIAAFLAYAGW